MSTIKLVFLAAGVFAIAIGLVILVNKSYSQQSRAVKKENKKQSSEKKTAKKAKQEKYLATGHPELPPIMWKQDKVITGAGPSLIKLIAEELGVDINVKHVGTWADVQSKTKNGEVDIIVATYKTSEGEATMEYSIPYTFDPIAVFVKSGKTIKVTKKENLVGKKGVATMSGYYGQLAEYMDNKLDVVRVDSEQEALEMVEEGEVDYFIYSYYSGETAVAKFGMQDKIQSLSHFIAAENLYIAISKKSPFLPMMDKVNDLLTKYKDDGTIGRLINENRNICQ